MIINREFNEKGRDLQQIIEQFLIDFYYEFCESNLA